MRCAADEMGVYGSNWPSDGLWHHLCYTYDGSSVHTVLDGVDDASWVRSLSTTSAANGGTVRIGSHTTQGSGNQDITGLNGRADEFYIYGR